MTRILLVNIRFLDARYHGLVENGERREWPPSPFRLFQALVAGNARGQNIPAPLQRALSWLESLVPPTIIAPAGDEGRTLLTYVLNNVSDTNPNSRAPKVIRPTLLNGDPLVQYAWAFDADFTHATENAAIIIRAAKYIRCLGWGIDLANGSGEITETFPEIAPHRSRYSPVAFGSTGFGLRAPKVGSLESLQRTHGDVLNRYESPGVTRLESAGAMYEPQRYAVGAIRPSIAFRLVNADGDAVAIRLQLIKPFVGLIRDLANRPHVVASLGQNTVDRAIMGHPKDASADRVSILPLPTVRDGPTDGKIRRLLLAQPSDSDGALCRSLGGLLDGQLLTPKKGEVRFPEIYIERIRGRDSVLPWYTGVSKTWASVTPVLLPGYDDRKDHRGNQVKRLERAEQLLRKAIVHAGLACTVRNIELTRVPYFTGSLHTRSYDVRDKLAHYPRYHVWIEFDQCITGPIALGAGRHVGFGILARCDKRK